MPINLQAGTGLSSSAGSATVPLPASVIAGDVLILMVDLASDTTATSPGWTEVYTDAAASDRFRVLTKTAGGSETDPTVTLGGALAWVALIIRARDADSTLANLTGQNSATTTASIDPTGTDNVKIGVAHGDPTVAGTTTWGGGATPILEIANAASAFIATAYKVEDTSGALTFTFSGTVAGPQTLIFSLAPGTPAVPPDFVPRVIAAY